MRKQLFAFSILSTIAIFLSCNSSQVKLAYTNAKDEVPVLGNLVFRFDKFLVADSLLNQWDSTEYISFEPEIEGRFRWEQPDQLVFSPSRPLPPATTFKAKLESDLLQYSKYGKVAGGEKITFNTPYLQLENSNVAWAMQEGQPASAAPQVDLYFNYQVKPAAIKDKLKVMIGGNAVEYNMQTLSDDSRI